MRKLFFGFLIFSLFLAGFFGFWFGKNEVSFLTKLKKSKVIYHWQAQARGEVIKISDRVLTLKEIFPQACRPGQKRDILTIPISQKAEVFKVSLEEGQPQKKALNFEDLKIGDIITVTIETDFSEKFEGIWINVLDLPQIIEECQ